MTSPPEMLPWDKVITCLLAVVLWMAPSCVPSAVKHYCNYEALEATCPADHVIVMEQARYGRMSAGNCVSKEYGHLGCFADVLPYMDYHCSGKRQCSVPVTSFVNDNIRPCPKDVTSYMEAAYHCQQVPHIPPNRQCPDHRELHLETGSGNISALTNRGDQSGCTWSLNAKPGQVFNVSMLDFGVRENKNKHEPAAYCHRYAILKDGTLAEGQREVAICAGSQRESHVYLSKSHVIQLQVFRSEQSAARFLLQYEVVGCPDLKLESDLQVSREGLKASVTCPDSGRSWTLYCKGNKWEGGYGNCTPDVQTTDDHSGIWQALFGDGWSSPKGLAVVVALGVLLGIIIGALLLCVMIFLLKKRNHHLPQSRDKDFATINHQRTPQADAESRDLEQDYFREKLLHVDCDPDLVTTGKCLCPDETMTMTSPNQETPPPTHGTMRSVYVYPRGATQLYEKSAYSDMIT